MSKDNQKYWQYMYRKMASLNHRLYGRIEALEAENKRYKEAWSVNILTKRLEELEPKLKQIEALKENDDE